jgi:hypothetical protein
MLQSKLQLCTMFKFLWKISIEDNNADLHATLLILIAYIPNIYTASPFV